MNIGVIVYSLTDHTLSVATKLKEELSAAGHGVTLERIETIGPASPRFETAALKTAPAVEAHDALVFGSPVRGGALPLPVAGYLEQIPSLEGKKVACLVTGFFPAAWGRNQTIAQMTELCEAKGGKVCGSRSVGWFSLRRPQQITQAVESLSACF